MTCFKEKNRSKHNYKKFCIDKKIKDIITKNNKKDNRYIVFKKVLSKQTITQCQFILPRQLYQLEPGRLFAVHGNNAVQELLRNQNVFPNKDDTRQKLKYPDFQLTVADKLGYPNPQLALQDRVVIHGTSLQVFCHSYNNSKIIFNLTIIYYRRFKDFMLMLLHKT